MLRTKKAERIACVATALMLLAAACLWGLSEPAQGDDRRRAGYEELLFDRSKVHTIDITMEDWEGFLANAMAEEYAQCGVAIDGEKYAGAGIRAKGNTSLSSVASMGSSRYSFKLEFDHYQKGMTYHGLDKLSLNNLIQDATMMKDDLAYTLMNRMGVPSPLCSYVQINVNGEPWGLYLAVEGVEEAFLDRNGMTKGELYKPDSMSFGGGRGNGRDFSLDQLRERPGNDGSAPETATRPGDGGLSFGGSSGAPADMPDTPPADFNPSGGESARGTTPVPDAQAAPDSEKARGGFPEAPGGSGFNFGMGSDDVKLIYSDDDPDHYANIFHNAKTSAGKKDQARLIEALRRLNAKEALDDTVCQDEVIRYLAVHHFLCNDDSYTGMMVHNYYLYEEEGRLSIIPWDYNLAFGGFAASSDATSAVNSPIDSPVSGGTVDSRPLIAWIFSDEDALADYHAAYDRFLAENLENGWLEREISRIQALITPYLALDTSAFYSMEAFEKAVGTLQTFCRKRAESIRGQLDGTIPATSQAQRDNRAALVDASDLSTADMGSMNAGGNGGGFQPPGQTSSFSGGFTPPSGAEPAGQESGDSFGGGSGGGQSAPPEPASPQETAAQPAETPAPDAAKSKPERQNAFPAGGNPPEGSQADQRGQWVSAALWSLILLAALLIIRRVESHNR